MNTPGNGSGRNDWQRIKALFESLLELPPAAREAKLVAAAAGPEALGPEALAEVRSLLAHHDAAATGGGGFMAADASSALAETPAPAVLPGQRLGAWEVVRAIGAGGMGEVFEARRADGSYEGRAAVKLLKRGMDSAAVLQRFAQERQALARLSHPHIARLLDAGASEQGLPYFVLEFVDGQAVDAAVVGLPLDARLQLFLQLADAVAHAHRNLLVHRDLKPGNVLVDREGQVKLLDFGIAKALDPLEHTDGHTTVAGQRPYTPHYASPEQIRGEPVSTATDIYSLGVLLYQMLTGTRPTGRKATTPAEAARSVLEDEPTRPSRLSPSEAVDPHWLATRKKLEGDLDNILLKALEKEPARRYASVDALAADVRAFLGGYPVSARAAGWRYRMAKRIARNRLVSGAVAAGVLALLGGVAGIAWQAHVAQQARQLAESRLAEVRRVTHELVFGFGDAVEYLPGGMKIKVDLYQQTLSALQRLTPTLGSDATVRIDIAQVHVRLAEAYAPGYPVSLNDAQRARGHAEAAVQMFQQLRPEVLRSADPNLNGYATRALSVLASLEAEADRKERALELNRQGLAWAQEALAAAPQGSPTLLFRSAVTGAYQALAILLDDNGFGVGRFEEALPMYRAGLASGLQELTMEAELAALDAKLRPEQTRYSAELRQTLAVIAGSLSSSLARRGDYAGAVQARGQAVEFLRVAQKTHPDQVQFQAALATSLRAQAVLQLALGEFETARTTLAESLSWTERLLATDRSNADWLDDREFATPLQGAILARLGRDAEALPWLERGLAYWRAKLAKGPSARGHREAAVGAFRIALSQARQAGAGERGAAWAAAGQAALALRNLSEATPKQADVWLYRAESEQALALEGPAVGRAGWQIQACSSWRRAAELRRLPPSVQVPASC
jgi:hypothetical protein